jgi:hypothetical protein
MMQPLPVSVVDDWTHEGPDDPDGDRLALAEALSELEHYRTHPQDAMNWETFKAQLQDDVGGMTQRRPFHPPPPAARDCA